MNELWEKDREREKDGDRDSDALSKKRRLGEPKRSGYDATAYLFSSARIRAKERTIIGRERLSRLIDAPGFDGVKALLVEYGVFSPKGEADEASERERMLLDYLGGEIADVASVLPKSDSEAEEGEPLLAALFRYPYDCNNLKAAIKCAFCGADPSEMLFDIGHVSAADALLAVQYDTYAEAGFAPFMCKAAPEAKAAYVKTKNPREIDFLLDQACYADMSAAAARLGIPFVIGYVKKKIDCTNILSTLRILRMYPHGGAVAEHTLHAALLAGGEIPVEKLENACREGREALREVLSSSDGFAYAADKLTSLKQTPAEAERCLDDLFMEYVCLAKEVPFGAEIALAYLAGQETALKNVRILCAGRLNGTDATTIRERMRRSYV